MLLLQVVDIETFFITCTISNYKQSHQKLFLTKRAEDTEILFKNDKLKYQKQTALASNKKSERIAVQRYTPK